jgi:hypothetical protein
MAWLRLLWAFMLVQPTARWSKQRLKKVTSSSALVTGTSWMPVT